MLSLIIPVYNGAEILRRQLPSLIEYLKDIPHEYEIIIVDDFSANPELTKEVAEEFQCIFLINDTDFGKGGAVRKGMLHAKGDYRIFTDSDVPFEHEAIEHFVQYLEFKEFDIVVGDRTLPESEYFDEISRNRKIGSAIFTFIVGRFITTGLFDTQCGLKGFRAAIAEDLFSVGRINGFAFDVEVLYIALKRNYDIKRLPVRLRSNESSTVKVFSHGIRMVMDLFRIKIFHVMGKYRKKTKRDK
ncbi:glycosyltransferase [Bacteroidota bacterium]